MAFERYINKRIAILAGEGHSEQVNHWSRLLNVFLKYKKAGLEDTAELPPYTNRGRVRLSFRLQELLDSIKEGEGDVIPLNEVARRLNTTPGSVMTSMSRIRDKYREHNERVPIKNFRGQGYRWFEPKEDE